jgi:hypothetical protein
MIVRMAVTSRYFLPPNRFFFRSTTSSQQWSTEPRLRKTLSDRYSRLKVDEPEMSLQLDWARTEIVVARFRGCIGLWRRPSPKRSGSYQRRRGRRARIYRIKTGRELWRWTQIGITRPDRWPERRRGRIASTKPRRRSERRGTRSGSPLLREAVGCKIRRPAQSLRP